MRGWEQYRGPVAPPARRRSKYGAVPHTVLPDLRILPSAECGAVAAGLMFHSKREAERFIELQQQMLDGVISGLTVQKQYAMHVVGATGVKVCIGNWVADFEYIRDGAVVVEDVKGFRTAVYQLKKRHVEAQYGIRILET